MHISEHFGLQKGHEGFDFVDVNTESIDEKLFIDPCLIEIGNSEFCIKAKIRMGSFFDKFYAIFRNETSEEDMLRFFDHMHERNEIYLGYRELGEYGKGNSAEKLLEKFSPLAGLIRRGIPFEEPIDLTIFIDGFAEDGLSDMLANILSKDLQEFTQQQCDKFGHTIGPLTSNLNYWNLEEQRWDNFNCEVLSVRGKKVLLVPKNIVRKGYYYNVRQYIYSQIIKRIRNERAETVDGKTIYPPVKEIEKQVYAGRRAIDIAVGETIGLPDMLNDYHIREQNVYQKRQMPDIDLDAVVYGKEVAE